MFLNKLYTITILSVFFLFVIEVFLEHLLRHLSIGGAKKLDLYTSNGKFLNLNNINLPTDTTTPGDLECSTETLVKCKVDDSLFGCAACKEILSQCVTFKEDFYDERTKVTIGKNLPGEGYCLPLTDDRNTRKCSSQYGGKWILVRENETGRYTFICLCNKENFFTKHTLLSDCSQFIGCRNGTIVPDWTNLSEIKCKCDKNYKLVPGTENYPPQCTKVNIFQNDISSLEFEPLDKNFISTEYLDLIGNDIFLPNPCHFDVTTRTFDKNIGQVVLDPVKQIAYCEATSPHYIEIITTDDYLRNNQGKYSNGIARITVKDLVSVQHQKDVVYEIYRNHKEKEDQPLEGRRLLYSQFLYQLPYFENSANVGNQGETNYSFVPVLDANFDNRNNIKVLVYRARKPKMFKIKLSNFLNWVPAYNTTSFESSHRIFNGVVPLKNLPVLRRNNFHLLYPNPPGRCVKYLLNDEGIIENLRTPNVTQDTRLTRYYAMPIFNNGEDIQPYSLLFTGTILTYWHKNNYYTKPLSPGNSVICTKYRQNYDPEWSNVPKERIYFRIHLCAPDFSLAIADDEHMFTENAINYERNEIGTPSKFAGKFRFERDTGKVIFAEKY